MKDSCPFFARKLGSRRFIRCRMVEPGIASCTVQVACAGDAGDQKARHMKSLFLQLLPDIGCFAARRRKPHHKGALFRILQGSFDRIRYDLFHTLFDMIL